MRTISVMFVAIVFALFVGSVVRMLRCPIEDPQRRERADVAVLLLLVFLGLSGASARDNFPVNSPQYWLVNGVLIPICLLAIWYISRLIRTYRGETVYIPKSSPRIHKPPILDPPKRNQNDSAGS